MVIASHAIFTAYGFWLPNEERGSWSDFVRSWELYMFGEATKVRGRRSRAHKPFNRAYRDRMSDQLRYHPVEFTGEQALCIANSFSDQTRRSGLIIHACAILPTHVHLVIKRHRYHVEQVVNLLKGAATRNLAARGMHPMRDQLAEGLKLPSPWTSGLWKVFRDSTWNGRSIM